MILLSWLGTRIYCKFGSRVFTGARVAELMIQYRQRILTNPSYQHCAHFWDRFIPHVASFGLGISLELRQQAACCPSMKEIHTFKTQHKGKTVRYYNTCTLLIIPADPRHYLSKSLSLIKIGSKTTSNCQNKLASLVTHRQKTQMQHSNTFLRNCE